MRLRRHLATPAAEGQPAPEPASNGQPLPIVSAFLAGETPWRLPVFAAIAVGLIVGAGIRFHDISQTAVVAVYVAVLVACAATDLATFRVLNLITYPAILFALLVGALMPGTDFPEAIAGGALAGGLMLLALIISRGAMGLGDVKLALFSGLLLGWPLAETALILTALAGGAAAVLLLVFGIKGRKDPIPYAPFISAATLAVILWQGTVFQRF
ncbi:MAG: prepilin peptidase [Dehalococcoidia bacterium]